MSLNSIKKMVIFNVIMAAMISAIVGFICCSRPMYNKPLLNRSETPLLPSESNIKQDPATLMFAAFSGGGSRATCMAWETLKCFKSIPYTYIDKDGVKITSNLADQIDYISGISGGSFAAAAWCLFKDSMEIFDERFVEKDIQGALVKRLLLSRNLLKIASPYYNRIHVAAEYYDEEVFKRKVFNNLPDHPVLWINSTHLALGLRFTYTQEYFNWLGSDVSVYPIGYACAASSAFPGLLSPMTLKSYGEAMPHDALMKNRKYSRAVRSARKRPEQGLIKKRIEFFNDKNNKWHHFADGGLVDNQGLQAIIDEFNMSGIISSRVNNATEHNPLKRLIFVNVNAGTDKVDNSCEKQGPPHIYSVINYTMRISMDRLSTKNWAAIKPLCKGKKEMLKKNGLDMETPYLIEINFRNIKDDSLKAKCNNLPTSFKLRKEDISLIRKTVPMLVSEDPGIIKLKQSLKGGN